VAELLTRLGIRPEHFAVRPLRRRGLSGEGLDIGEDTTVPELTASADGLHWHPAGADAATSPTCTSQGQELHCAKASGWPRSASSPPASLMARSRSPTAAPSDDKVTRPR